MYNTCYEEVRARAVGFSLSSTWHCYRLSIRLSYPLLSRSVADYQAAQMVERHSKRRESKKEKHSILRALSHTYWPDWKRTVMRVQRATHTQLIYFIKGSDPKETSKTKHTN